MPTSDQYLKQHSGFTIYETIVVIALMGLIGIFVLPKIIEQNAQARKAAEDGGVNAVRSGIGIYVDQSRENVRSPLYPAALDDAANKAASDANPLFAAVLEKPLTGGWSKTGTNLYVGPANGEYWYDPATGVFDRLGRLGQFSNFDNGDAGWSAKGPSISVQGGQYVLGPGGENRSFSGSSSWTDYIVDVDANLFNGNGYGILFRVQEAEPFNGYSFQYDPGWAGGSFIMRRWVNGSEQAPFASAPPPSPSYQWENMTRHVRLDVKGRTFNAYVDGQLVLSGTNPTYASGSVGLRVWGGSARFDNYLVTLP